jgi:hypothetical protein
MGPPSTPVQDTTLKTPKNTITYCSKTPKTVSVPTVPPLFTPIEAGCGLGALQQAMKEVTSTPNKIPSSTGTTTPRTIFPPQMPLAPPVVAPLVLVKPSQLSTNCSPLWRKRSRRLMFNRLRMEIRRETPVQNLPKILKNRRKRAAILDTSLIMKSILEGEDLRVMVW